MNKKYFFYIKIPKLIFYGIRTKLIQKKDKLIEMDRRVIPSNDKQQQLYQVMAGDDKKTQAPGTLL